MIYGDSAVVYDTKERPVTLIIYCLYIGPAVSWVNETVSIATIMWLIYDVTVTVSAAQYFNILN